MVTIQIIGVVLANTSQSRAATLTDAALIAHFVDHTMKEIEFIDSQFGYIGQYRCSQMKPCADRVYLALPSDKSTIYRMNLAMGPAGTQRKY